MEKLLLTINHFILIFVVGIKTQAANPSCLNQTNGSNIIEILVFKAYY